MGLTPCHLLGTIETAECLARDLVNGAVQTFANTSGAGLGITNLARTNSYCAATAPQPRRTSLRPLIDPVVSTRSWIPFSPTWDERASRAQFDTTGALVRIGHRYSLLVVTP